MARGTTVISAADEADLIRKAQAGDNDAMAELIAKAEAQIGGVVAGYARMATTPQLREDLTQEAVIGFIAAVRAFDVDSGVRLWAYAKFHVQKAINNGRRAELAVPIPEDTQRTYGAAMRKARATLGDGADPAELYALGESYARQERMVEGTFFAAHCVLTSSRAVLALDNPHTVGDLGSTPWEAATSYSTIEDRDEAASYLAKLSDAERSVIVLAVGLGNGEPMSDQAIADRLGMTRPTVQRIRTRALAAMRAA